MKNLKSIPRYIVLSLLFFIVAGSVHAALIPTTTSFFFNTTDNTTVTGTLGVLNTNNQTVTVSFSSPNNLNITVPQNANITANETKDFNFSVALEPFKQAGTYTSSLAVQNTNNASENATMDLTLLVNERKVLDVSELALDFSLTKGSKKTKILSLKNSGNVNLTNISFSSGNNNSLITETFSPLVSIKPGESKEFNYTLEIDDSLAMGTYSWKWKVTSESIEKEINVMLKVSFSYCGKEAVGNKVDITLEKPDSSDDFKIGEKAEGEVTVHNTWTDNMEFVVKALLYNLDKDKEVSSLKIGTVDVDEDEEESLQFTLDLESSDIDPNDEYKVYVKAYEKDNEEQECSEDSGKFSLDVEDHEVIISRFELTPKEIDCGDLAYIEFEVANIGKKDEHDVWVEVKNAELKLDEKSEQFDLEKAGDKENKYTVRFTKQMPDDVLGGEYEAKAKVFYNKGEDMYSDAYGIQLTRCRSGLKKTVQGTLNEGDIRMDVISSTVKAKPGKTFVVPISIKNSGTVKAEVSVGIANAEGVGTPGVDKTLTLIPGHATILYLDIVANPDLEAGKRSLTINVKSDEEILATYTVAVDIIEGQEKVKAGTETKQFLSGAATTLSSSLQGGNFWFLGDIILILLAVFLVRSIFKRD